jgi:hypothetical protein
MRSLATAVEAYAADLDRYPPASAFVLPAGLEAVIDERQWPNPAVFDWLQRAGHIERDEMHQIGRAHV